MKKLSLLLLLVVLLTACSDNNENLENESVELKENAIETTSLAKTKITITISTGMSTFYNEPCFDAWDICISIEWGKQSNSSIDLDYDNQLMTLVIDTKGEENFYSQKTSSGKFELVDPLFIPSEITSKFSNEGKDIYIDKGFHDFTMIGDIMTITTSFIKI